MSRFVSWMGTRSPVRRMMTRMMTRMMMMMTRTVTLTQMRRMLWIILEVIF